MTKKSERDVWIEMSIREISTQAHFADVAYGHLDPKADAGTDAVFSSIHSFLSRCAMVSKMLMAHDDSSSPVTIGGLLGVASDSLIHERAFRNHLEHYDERLRKWIRLFGPDAPIGTYNVGTKAAIQLPGVIYVSHYDPNTNVFTFVNEDFDLSTLHADAKRILALADAWVHSLETAE
jgi:hypothetical protein